jgi:hypothetical protein
MSQNLVSTVVFFLANVNNVTTVLYLIYAQFLMEELRLAFGACLCVQPGVYYLVYLRAGWVSLREEADSVSPEVILFDAVGLLGLLPGYVLLGTVKLLHTHWAYIYLAPQRPGMTPREWFMETKLLPLVTQGLLQCVPCVGVALTNGIDVTSVLHVLFAWSSLAMSIVGLVVVCSLRQNRRREVD